MKQDEVYLTTIEVRGVDFRIAVNDRGYFFVEDDPDVKAKDLEILKSILQDLTKRSQANVSVPFVTRAMVRGVARGFHAGGDKLLVTIADGVKGQYDDFFALDDMDDETLKQGQALRDAYYAAHIAWDEFEIQHRFNLAGAVKEAIKGIPDE
jgi:hypothetical protein